MEPAVIVAIVSVVIGFFGFVFGVYKYFSTRRVARIIYEVCQMSDYNMPAAFLRDMASAPVMVLVESSGNKKAENVVVQVQTKSEIEEYKVEPEDVTEVVGGKDFVKVSARSLNPTQKVKVLLDSKGNPSENQIKELEITHSEGVGINKRSAAYTKLSFNSLFCDLEFDLNARTLKLVRLGPWRFR